MLSLVPLPYRIAAGVLLAVVMLGGAYYKGYSGEHDKLTAYKAQVAQAAADQAIQTKAKDAQNEENSKIIVQGWKSDHDRLVAALNGMRNSNGGGSLPQAANGQQGHDEYVSVEGGTCSKAFYGKALEAELMLETWQKWAVSHNLSVE